MAFNVPLQWRITSFFLLAEALAATLEARGLSGAGSRSQQQQTSCVSHAPAAAAAGPTVQKGSDRLRGVLAGLQTGRAAGLPIRPAEAARPLGERPGQPDRHIRRRNEASRVDVIRPTAWAAIWSAACSKAWWTALPGPTGPGRNNAIAGSIRPTVKRRDDAGSSSFIDRLDPAGSSMWSAAKSPSATNIKLTRACWTTTGPFHDGLKHPGRPYVPVLIRE